MQAAVQVGTALIILMIQKMRAAAAGANLASWRPDHRHAGGFRMSEIPMRLSFIANGIPRGQGNHRRNRHGATYETTKGHGLWRGAVIAAARAEMHDWERRRPLEAVDADR